MIRPDIQHRQNDRFEDARYFLSALIDSACPTLKPEDFSLDAMSRLEKDSIDWTVFKSGKGMFGFGISTANRIPFKYNEILLFLEKAFTTSFKIDKDAFVVSDFNDFNAYVFSDRQGQQLILALSASLKFPAGKDSERLRFAVELPLFMSQATNTCYSIYKGQTFNFIKCEEMDIMDYKDENLSIAADMKIGSLEISLEDLLSLKPGSQISFSLQNGTEVKLEIENRTFATAVLEKATDDNCMLLTVKDLAA